MLDKFTQFKDLLKSINPSNWSISTKLLIAFFSAATIPMSLIAHNNLKLGLENLAKNEYYKLETIAVSNASRLDQLIIDHRLTINQIARNSDIVRFLTADSTQSKQFDSRVRENLDVILRSSPDYDAVFVMDKDGICRASTDPTFIGQDYRLRDYFKEAILSDGLAAVSFLVGSSGRPGLYFAHPIRSEKGDLLGVAVLKMQGLDVSKTANSISANSPVQSFLVNEQGVVIAHPNNSFLYRSLDKLSPAAQKKLTTYNFSASGKIESLELPALAEAMVGATKIGYVNYYSPIEQTQQITGFSPLESKPWVLGVNQPRDLFEAPMRAMIWQNTYFVLLVGGVAVLVSLLLSQQLVKPIRVLIKAGKALQTGDFKPEMLAKVSRSQDDLGRLAYVFLQMAEEINNREQNLKSQVKELRVEINETKKDRQIAEITGTEYFKELQKKARRLKSRANTEKTTEAEYYQNLHEKVKEQRTRFTAHS
jgi:C4-dicarboxylate-specific signal transduction histidine kinase